MGEYPLAWAACLGNETIYNLLLDQVWGGGGLGAKPLSAKKYNKTKQKIYEEKI